MHPENMYHKPSLTHLVSICVIFEFESAYERTWTMSIIDIDDSDARTITHTNAEC